MAAAIERDGLYLASLAATGFMCIKRHVLERVAADSMAYPEQDYMRGTIPCWDMFRTGTVPNRGWSRTRTSKTPIVTMAEMNREIFVFKNTVTEVWVDVGSSPFAFARLDGVYIEAARAPRMRFLRSATLWCSSTRTAKAMRPCCKRRSTRTIADLGSRWLTRRSHDLR
jgi:hypothetical protein